MLSSCFLFACFFLLLSLSSECQSAPLRDSIEANDGLEELRERQEYERESRRDGEVERKREKRGKEVVCVPKGIKKCSTCSACCRDEGDPLFTQRK